MRPFFFSAFLLSKARISCVLFCDALFEELLQLSAGELPGRNIKTLFPTVPENSSDITTVYISGRWIHCFCKSFSDEQQFFLAFISSGGSEEIYQFAMDLIDIGVQIYHGDSTLMFINAASEDMSGIKREEVVGRYLTSIYDTNEQQSSVLASIANHTSIYDKMDTFTVMDGKQVSVLNTAIPFFNHKGELNAVVNLEYTEDSITRLGSTIKAMQKIIPHTVEKRSPLVKKYYHFEDIIGHSACLKDALKLARIAAKQNSNILILGETGTGKEMVAQSIYSISPSCRSFVSVNCSTISEGLADATLFGTVKGAFTGSTNSDGLFSAADGGILFLDEINSLSLSTQARLLRVLQEGTYMKVGAVTESTCNVRVLAACNQDPMELVQEGKFRQDLFFRLASVTIKIPPLRERLEDLEELLGYYLAYYSKKFSKNVTSISKIALEMLYSYPWPGNVRELKNTIEFAVNVCQSTRIELHDLPAHLQKSLQYSQRYQTRTQINAQAPAQINLEEQLGKYERALIERALCRNEYNITKTADSLSLSRQALQYKLKKYKILII